MMKIYYSLFSFLILTNLLSQVDTLFWFAAPEVSNNNANFDRPILFRISALDLETEIIVDQPANATFLPLTATIPAGQTISIDLTTWIDQIENKPSNTVLDNGLRIRSTNPVTAYYEVVSSFCNCNPEIFALKGKNAMGLTFYIPGQHFLSNSNAYTPTPFNAFDIVASEDNTQVTITTTQNIVGHQSGQPFTITLNKGQTYSATATGQQAAQHLHGSFVNSNKPIAITVKDDLLAGTAFGGCADLAGDQNIPITIVGKEYIPVRGSLNAPYDQVFVLATEDNTTVSANGVNIVTLNQGQSYNYAMGSASSVYITSTKPIYVTQLSGFGCEVGMSILPPIICTGSKRVSFSRSTSESLFLILLVPNGAEGSFTLNGNTGVINASDFQVVPGTNNEWLFAKLTIPTNIVSASGTGIVANDNEFFHLGIIHGSAGGGCRYGYFSDFSAFSYEISASSTSVCEGNPLVLSSNIINGATYNWTGPNGFTSSGTEIVFNTPTVNQSGYYFVSGNLPDACQLLEDSIYIEVHPQPSVQSLVFEDLCDGESLSISYNVEWHGATGGISSIEFGDPNMSVNPNSIPPVQFNYGGPGEFLVVVTATSPAGCTSYSKISAQVNPIPSVSISSNSKCTDIVDFYAQISMGNTSSELQHSYWIINNDSIPNTTNPSVQVNLDSGTYQGLFGIVNTIGCNYMYAFDYFVDTPLEIETLTFPNVITPNNDGINDYFIVDDVFDSCIPYSIDFINRWGQVVFSTHSNTDPFGGLDSTGKLLSEGVYFYRFNSDLIQTHGLIHVFRE